MTIEKQIEEYLYKVSRGKIVLVPGIAEKIRRIAVGQGDQSPVAKLYRYNALKEGWEIMYVVKTSDEAIEQAILTALDHKPVEKFYRWDCYNSLLELQGSIYTTNTNIF